MSKLYEFFYMNKKKIIISVICLFVIVIGLMSFYFINYKYNNHVKKEIISEEIVKHNKPQETKNDEIETIANESNNNIFVDIKGEVINPGVYELLNDSRVIDAINAAGGFTNDSYTRYLNLSKKLEDENVIIVNSITEIEEIKSRKNQEIIKETENTITIKSEEIITNDFQEPKVEENDNNSKETKEELNLVVNINTATIEELNKINGIGESTAKKIIEYREENGKFESIEDIKKVKGIGDKKYDQIKEYITVK